MLEAVEHFVDIAIIHLVGIEQWPARLALDRIGPAVPIEAALRNIRFGGGEHGAVGVSLGDSGNLHVGGRRDGLLQLIAIGHLRVGTDREIRRVLKIGKRRHRPYARAFQIGAAKLHGQSIRRGVSVRRAMARCAGKLAGTGQRRIEKHFPAELRERRKLRGWAGRRRCRAGRGPFDGFCLT